MERIERIQELGRLAVELNGELNQEERTKASLISPFIHEVLGYNVFDPREVVREHTADIGNRQQCAVDYAIFHQGEPMIIVEAKKVSVKVEGAQPAQLQRYFNNVRSAKVGIFTNGIEYVCYADVDDGRGMDAEPFLTFDVRHITPGDVVEIERMAKGAFEPGAIRQAAATSVALKAVRNYYAEPSDEHIKQMMSEIAPDIKVRTAAKVAEYRKLAVKVLGEMRGQPEQAVAEESGSTTRSSRAEYGNRSHPAGTDGGQTFIRIGEVCSNGHTLTANNIRIHPRSGHEVCKDCDRVHSANARERARERKRAAQEGTC